MVVRLTLTSNWLPDTEYGKDVTFRAHPRSSSDAVQSGSARELAEAPGTYEFSVAVNMPGDWRIDAEAKWGDGRSFSKEWVEFLDVP